MHLLDRGETTTTLVHSAEVSFNMSSHPWFLESVAHQREWRAAEPLQEAQFTCDHSEMKMIWAQYNERMVII